MDDMTWRAAMDSEIFRNYAENELQRIQIEQQVKNASEDEEIINTVESFEKLEREIKASPDKLKVFRALQEKFASDEKYTASVKKSFVDAVMLLNLD